MKSTYNQWMVQSPYLMLLQCDAFCLSVTILVIFASFAKTHKQYSIFAAKPIADKGQRSNTLSVVFNVWLLYDLAEKTTTRGISCSINNPQFFLIYIIKTVY